MIFSRTCTLLNKLNSKYINATIELIHSFEESFKAFNSHLFLLKNNLNKEQVTHDDKLISLTQEANDMKGIIKIPSSSIINKLKPKSNGWRNVSISNEAFIFRQEFYKNFNEMEHKHHQNLSNKQIKVLKKFYKERPFCVLPCDKNIGSAIISNELMIQLGMENLNDKNTYLQLESNPLEMISTSINDNLRSLFESKDINKQIWKMLHVKDAKIGKFRILPKLHKSKFGIRPIVSSIGHPNEKICALIDACLQTIVQNTSTFLKDSQQLLQLIENKRFNCKEVFLYSCDFESLYTNINKDDAIPLITEYVKNFLDTNYISAKAFKILLDIAFTTNVFKFQNQFYIQIRGVAMGCKCGPSIANLFVYILERHWLNIHNPLIYKRFIDDMFIMSEKEIQSDSFNNQFLNLKLNIQHGKSVNFLDLTLKYDDLTVYGFTC